LSVRPGRQGPKDGQAAEEKTRTEVRWCRPFVELYDQPAGVGLRFIDTPLRAAFVVGALRRSRPVATAAPGRR